MSKQFWGFLGVGAVVVAVAVWFIWSGTAGNHLTLSGKIIKVRSMPLEEGRSLVVVDFRVTNPSDIPFVVSEVSISIQRPAGMPLKGQEVSRGDVDTMFAAHPILQPKYNDVLAPPDQIAPGKTLDRMAEASFEASSSEIDARKQIVVHIEDVDGAGFDIEEKPETK